MLLRDLRDTNLQTYYYKRSNASNQRLINNLETIHINSFYIHYTMIFLLAFTAQCWALAVAHCRLSELYIGRVSSPRITPNMGWVRFF